MKVSLFFGLMWFAIMAQAQVYKWVDDDGQVHFSQFPPEDDKPVESVDIRVGSSMPADAAKQKLENIRQKLLESSMDRNLSEEERLQKQAQAEDAEKRCQQARDQLITLQQNGRVYQTDEQGERQWLDEKKRQDLINETQQRVKELCQ